MNEKQEMNKLGTAPIGKLMLSMGIPIILSMMMQALYNIVDSAFVARIPEVGESALNALTLAFPVHMLMVAVGIGTGVGTNALLSKSLGQGNREKASRVAGNSVFVGFILYAIFLLFGIFGTRTYISSQTSNPQIVEMGVTYLQICCIVSFGMVFFPLYEKQLQATGRTVYSTIAQLSGAVANIILDPIFIFGYFGLPAMGVAGAAWATVIGQILSFVLAFIFNLKKNTDIDMGFKYLKPSGKIIGEIYKIGLPAIIAQALTSIMTYGLNIILVQVDETAVTAYGLYYKIQQFILFAAFGMRDTITPVVSFNHGMRSKKRIMDGVKFGMLYTVIIMAIGTIVLEIFAEPIATAFGLSDMARDFCISAMRVISISFVFAGINVAFQGIFQALDSGVASLIISVCRQFLFVLPVASAFSKVAIKDPDKIWLVWSTFIIAEVVSAVIATFFMSRIYKNKIKVLGGKQ